MISHDSVYALARDVRFRIFDGEAVIVRQDAGEILVASQVGARILELLDGELSVALIFDQLAAEYEVSREQLERDSMAFLDQLIELGVIDATAR